MENTQLISLLNTLDNKALKLLKKWVASPFYNQRTDVIQLLDFYLKYRKKKQVILTKEEIFKNLFPNEPYDDHRIRMVMSFLNRLTEKFIIQQKQQKKVIENKLALLTYYREQDLAKSYQKVLKEVEKIIEQDSLKGIDYYRAKYLFSKEKYESIKLTKRFQPKELLQVISNNLDICILIEKLRQSSIIQNDSRIVASQFDLGLLKPLKTAIAENSKYLKIPAIATYHACYELENNLHEHKYFEQLKKMLTIHESLFTRKELLFFYTYLTIFCTFHFNKGKYEYLASLLEIYKKTLSLGLYGQKINSIIFKNIALTGLLNKAYDWTEQFITQYTPKLDKEHQHSLGNWALAALAHRRKEYDVALEILQTTKFKDFYYNTTARITITKIYVELEKWETLQNHLKAFEAYARRLPDMGELGKNKTNYLNFTLFAQKILRLNPFDTREKHKLLAVIQASTEVADKKWLLEWLENGQ